MRTPEEQSLPRPPDSMADSISYPTTNHYIPPHAQYYSNPHVNHGHVHVVSPPPRPETTQRKRPKYTRSKTGCLTCRVKKIKCDETKPNCMRCTHGQRDCTWPEGVPARKKSAARKDTNDGRPSTAGSSGLSEGSTPPTRDHTPPRRAPVDLGLPPLASRRHTEPYLQLHPMSSEPDTSRRQNGTNSDRGSSAQGYPHHSAANSNVLSMIPEISSYPTQPRYEHAYPNGAHPATGHRHSIATSVRTMGHQSVSQWNPPPIMQTVDPIEPYFHNVQERNLILHYCDTLELHAAIRF